MNKIYKVIWSKAKHTYVVASEIAKGHTKGETTGRGLKKLAAAMLVAAALLSPNFAWAADTATVELAGTGSTATVEVYTTGGTDTQVNAAKTYTYRKVAAEAATREAKDNELNERITNEANGIHDEIKAGDKALDDRITNVKEYLEKQTSDTYVSKDDAAVQNGAIVKAANTIGENVTNLDAALAKETAARLGADKAQDKVIQQVNQNMVDGFNTINKNMADGFTALNQADANELAGRVAADKELVKATNGGLALNDKNVLQKNETIIAEDGTVKTTTTAADTLIMNEGKTNQITLSENGIKVGLNSGVMDKDGFYAGADDYAHASAALKSDGSIKGADGKFTVDGTTGNVSTKGSLAAASGTIGNVSMSADGTVTGVKDLTASGKVTADSFTDGTATMSNGSLNGVNQINATGNIVTTDNMKAHDITAEGMIKGENINGTTGTFGSLTTTGNASVGGTLTTNGITNTGNATTDTLKVNHNATVGGDLAVTGDITGKSLNVGTGAISGGQITGTGLDVGAGTIKTTGAVETGTLETTGNATIGGNLTVDKDLTVNGTFDAKTLSSTVDANNYTTINGGKTQSMNLKMDAGTGETKASASTFDENGSNAWAKDDDSIGKSSMTADKISQSLSDTGDNPKNAASRVLSQNTDNKYEIADSVVDANGNSNTSTQTASESNSTITGTADEKEYRSYITQNMKKILQGIKEGSNESTVDQTETGIKSTATDGKNTASTNLSNNGFNTYATDGTNKTYTKQTATDIKNTAENGTISNTAKDLVNTASENMTNTVGKNLETTVGGEMKTTVTGNVTEDFKADLSTTVGGNKSETVTGTSMETVTRKKTENYNGGLETTVTGDEKHTVNGNQSNTVKGTLTETVTGDVTEDYKANLSTKVGGNQTTTVTGDSSLSAKNITNTATEKLSNSAAEIENSASKSITDKVGDNVSRTMTTSQIKESVVDGANSNTSTKTGSKDMNIVTDGTSTSTLSQLAGSVNTSLKEVDAKKTNQVFEQCEDGFRRYH